jgi:hypothetical protein
MDSHNFIDQFREEYSYLWLLHRSFFMIERGKKFKLAVIALCCLLRNRVYFKERGHWWHRLGMNLKHLKMKNDAFKAMNLALKDEFVAGDKLNCVLKYRLALYIELNRPTVKLVNKTKSSFSGTTCTRKLFELNRVRHHKPQTL